MSKNSCNLEKRHYIRVFSIKKNVRRANFLLNKGYSYNSIAAELKCNHSSVISFKRRQEEKGIIFEKFGRNRKKVIRLKEFFIKKIIEIDKKDDKKGEKINPGKSYEDYLVEYEKKVKPIMHESMKRARRTIKKNNKRREREGISDEGGWGWH